MRQIISFLILLFCSIQGYGSDLMRECREISPRCYELSWSHPAEESEAVYHLFAADRWQDLMPLEAPSEFLFRCNILCLKTDIIDQTTVRWKADSAYLRIVGEASNGRFFDVAPLLHFPAGEVSAKRLASACKNRQETLNEVAPYLMTDAHHAKAILDKTFSKPRVLATVETMKKAGLKIVLYRQGRGLVLAKHPKLKNYLIKTYLDSDPHAEWTKWVRRAKGRDRVNAALQENPQYAKYLKVPRKWIYQIPPKGLSEPQGDIFPKEFILLVEDMKLCEQKRTEELYFSSVSYAMMDGLYVILDKSGYSDGHIANLPFCKDRKIAFIDTEFTHSWPVHPEWLTKWFSPFKQIYWKQLIENHGP